jgi:predicted TIM-barrel fold metal-dependent hydrolase
MSWKPSEKLKIKTPIPTRIISNGEYDPLEQTDQQKDVEKNILEIARHVAGEQGLSRRDVLVGTGAITIGLLALNKVFGHFFRADMDDAISLKAQNIFSEQVKQQYIFDIQTHMVKDNFYHPSLIQFAEWAKKINQSGLNIKSDSVNMKMFQFPNFLKEIFIDSDTDQAILSGATFSNGDPLPNQLLFDVVRSVNDVAQEDILSGYYVINPRVNGWLERCRQEYVHMKPVGWKLFPVGDPLSPTGRPWRLDDEKLIYPFYELAQKSGIKNICIHKGLLPISFEKKFPENWHAAGVADLEKAAKDWPGLNFIIFHSALRPFPGVSVDAELSEFRKTGYLRWTSDLARIKKKLDAKNIFAEIGTSFASSCITNPEFCAVFLGLLINDIGVDNVLWGTDSVWYGSPQWQIEAFRRFQIPKEILDQQGWKLDLGEVNGVVRNKILGLNSAELFGLSQNKIRKKSKFKSEFIERAQKTLSERSNQYYGYHK